MGKLWHLTAVLFVACDSATAVSVNPVGSFHLVEVSGAPLPHNGIRAGSLVIRADGTYRQEWTVTLPTAGTTTAGASGTWEEDGEAIRLRPDVPPPEEVGGSGELVGFYDGERLTLLERFIPLFVYEPD